MLLVWHPHQLRHAYGKRAREAMGLDVVRAQLGHETYEMSNHYAETEKLKLVKKAARKLG